MRDGLRPTCGFEVIPFSDQRRSEPVHSHHGGSGIPSFDAKTSSADRMVRTGTDGSNPSVFWLYIESTSTTTETTDRGSIMIGIRNTAG